MASRLRRGRGVSAPPHPDDVVLLEKWSLSRKLWLLAAVGFVLLIALAFGYDRMSAGNFFPSTRIGVVVAGSLSVDEAEAKLHDEYVLPLRKPIKLEAPEYSMDATPWDMGMRVDTNGAARDALARQQAESFPERIWHRVFGDTTPQQVKPSVDDKLFDAFLKDTYKTINQEPQDARLDVSRDVLDVVPHKLGRKVDKSGAERAIFGALTSGDTTVAIPVDVVQPALRTEAFKRVILVNTTTNRLVLYKNGKAVKKYGVATGTGGYPTPRGQWRITLKRVNPTWYNPNADWSKDMPAFIPPGPYNPLGTRALNLNASGIRIHGTPDDNSIGTNASHGCIRMHMPDVQDLFERVDVGTPVLII